jgi:hypothetical protein
MACGKLEVNFTSTCTGGWTNISGEDQSVSGTEQARKSGEAYTLDGDTAIIEGGKREPMELVFAIVYTEAAGEAYTLIRTQWETACGGKVCVRWSPKGGNPGDEQLATPYSLVSSFTYPEMDASAGGPIMAGFKVKAPYVATTTIAS